jgi:CDP-diglyceride synthetase
MPAPELAPRRTIGGVIAVWVVAAVVGVAIGVFVPEEWRAAWLTVGLGGCVVLSFAVQLWYGRSQQFIERIAASALGAMLVMGVVSAGFGLAAIIPG